MEKCIDISKHQTAFDAAKCKAAGITTVICRLAYSSYEDVKAGVYMPAVKSAGMKLGGYGFGTWHYKSVCGSNLEKARTVMRNEVNAWIAIARKYGINSWLGIDQELEREQTMGLSIGDNTTLLIEAAKMIADAGFSPCLYTGVNWAMNQIRVDNFNYPMWIAYYKWYRTQKDFDNVSETFPTSGTYGRWMDSHRDKICAWQFSSEGYADKYGCTHGNNGLDKNWLYSQPSAQNAPSSTPVSQPTKQVFDEYCLFPMSTLRVTQGLGFAVDGVPANTYSHLYQTAYDIAGEDTGRSPVYAPFSCKVMRIYNGSTTASKCNFTWYANTKRVKCMNEKVYAPGDLFFMTAHCNDDMLQKYGIKVGAAFKQGQICGYEGTAGGVGAHCHITFGEGPWDGKGWHEIKNRRGMYEINNPLMMHKICWLRLECKVLDGGGYTWVRISKTIKLDNVEGNDGAGNTTLPDSINTGSSSTIAYFPAYSGTSGSINAALSAIGVDNSYSYREKIAAVNGITGYRGTPAQNTQMVNLLKKGKLIKPTGSDGNYFPAYTGNATSIAPALKQMGIDNSYTYRSKVAAANSFVGYKGTAAQNTQMLNLLKQGKLMKP